MSIAGQFTPLPGERLEAEHAAKTAGRRVRWRHLLRSGGWTTRGLIAAAMAGLFMTFAVASVTQPLSTGDETAHVDYAYQIWHGQLPVFEKGLTFHPPKPAVIPPVQWESQHPPLFYALVSPLVGPLIDSHRWIAATMAMRFANCLVTALLIVALGLAAAAAVDRYRSRWTIASASAGTTIGAVIFVGGTAYSDPMLGLTTAVAGAVALRAVNRGVNRNILIGAAVIAAVGAVARAEFVIALLILAGSLGLACLIRGTGSRLERLTRGTAAATIPVVAAGLSSGWFYLRNKRLTGSFSGGNSDWAQENLHRGNRTFSSVLHLSEFWKTQFSLLRHPLDGRHGGTGIRADLDVKLMAGIFALLVVCGVVAALIAVVRALLRRAVLRLAVVLVLALMALGTFLFEVTYRMGGGATITRYLLPAVVPIAMLLPAALSLLPFRAQPAFFAAYLACCYGLFCWWLLEQEHGGFAHQVGIGGVPWGLVVLTVPLTAVAGVVQVRAFSRLPGPDPEPAR